MIKYYCSNGERVSEATIKKRLSEAYREKYGGNPHPYCEGCGAPATETSHILAKAKAKTLHKTELIWHPSNLMPSCRECHRKWEAIHDSEWCYLMNVTKLLDFLKKYDVEGYNKRMLIYETKIEEK